MSEPNFVLTPLGSVAETPAPTRVHRCWSWLVLIVVVGGCVAVAPLVYATTVTIQQGRSLQRALVMLQEEAVRRDWAAASASLQVARQDLEATRRAWQWAAVWRNVPVVGTHIQALDKGLTSAELGVEAATEVLQAAQRVDEAYEQAVQVPELATELAGRRTWRDFSREDKRMILARMDQALPAMRAAREKALIAVDTWERIPFARLTPPIRRAFQPMTESLHMFMERSQTMVDVMALLVPLAGFPEPKTYVVVLQNADELRPTGGFMGTVGVVRVETGEITQQSFQDVYAYDRVASSTRLGPPPEPLQRELGVKAWFLRDSNWSPDVPTSAERIRQIFSQEGWGEIDGVVFLQPNFFADLLKLTGPLSVDGVTFTPEGFFDQLQYAVEVGFAKQQLPVEARKDIVSHLGEAVLARLLQQPTRAWVDFFDVGVRALTRKDVMLVVRDVVVQQRLDAKRWSGRVRAAEQDEVWVVDTNLAALKTDGVMNKRVDYTLDMMAEGGPLATVRLTYTNTGQVINWRYTRYRDYVRVFVPEGSELVASQGAMAKDLSQSGGRVVPGQVDVMHDLGKTVFGAFWAIEPRETRTLAFTYRLPERILRDVQTRGRYALLVQKQPGAKHRLTVEVRLGKKITSAAPPEEPTQFGDNRYRITTDVDTDKVFEAKVK